MIEPLKHCTLNFQSMLLHVQLLFADMISEEENTPIQDESVSELLPSPYAAYWLSRKSELSDRSLHSG